MENWRIVKGFENYSVSDTGNLRNNASGKMLKPMISTCGYVYFHLIKDEKKHTKYVHRMVGESFIPNPKNLPQIDHVDGNKLNNTVSNLRWVTISENRMAYGSDERARNRMREVVAVNENGDRIVFDSRLSLAEHFGCHPSKVKYGYKYTRSSKKGWIFYKVEDIV